MRVIGNRLRTGFRVLSFRRSSLFQISEITNGLIDPILSRRAGINSMLLGIWDEIAGPEFADCTRPEKIVWPRRVSEIGEGEPFRPATLTVACEGARAIFLAHAQDRLIERINGFFGYPAVDRIRIVQKPLASAARIRKPVTLSENDRRRLAGMLEDVEDDGLKAALERLGRAVIARNRAGR